MPRIRLMVVLALALAGVAATGATGAQTAAAQATPPAAATTGQYSATVPVAGTSDAQRDAAIANALAQVLGQVSPGVVATPDELAQASGYVRDFHFMRAASGNGLALQVDFDPGAIGRLVAANQAAALASASSTAAAGGPATAGSAAPAAAVTGGSGDIWVDGIAGSDAFAGLLSTLRNDADLRDVTPVAADGNGVMLHVDCNRPLAMVLAGLTAAGGHLQVAAQPHPGAEAALHWVP